MNKDTQSTSRRAFGNDNRPLILRLLSDLVMGWRFYSRLPSGAAPHEPPALARMAPVLPLVSLLVGLGPALCVLGLALVGMPLLPATVLGLIALVLITGAMAEDAVARTMGEFGIRYIVWLDGYTETTDRQGSISCTIGPGGGGCFGFGTWEDDANFDARVWDVGSLTNVGTINTDATGQSYLPALVVPIPLIARVEANACNRLAAQLKDFVNGS